MEPLTCEQCGGPMKTRKQCPWCRTEYYLGPDLPEKPPEFWGMSAGTAMPSSSAVFSQYLDTAVAPNVVSILAPWE